MVTAVVVTRISVSISLSAANHVTSSGFKYPSTETAIYSEISIIDTITAFFHPTSES